MWVVILTISGVALQTVEREGVGGSHCSLVGQACTHLCAMFYMEL